MRIRVSLRALLLLGPLTLSASLAQGADPFGLDSSAPTLQFDVPRRVIAHEILPPRDADPQPPGKLVRVTVPVSLRLVEGDIHRVREVALEIEAAQGGLVVVDFAPRTTLTVEQEGEIQVIKTQERARSLDASLGGQLPLAAGAGTAQVTPSVSAGDRRKEVETVTSRQLPPKKPLFVSGTLNEGRGAFFQFRPSTQSTLEGQHLVSATFRVPDEWQGEGIEVRCLARGTRKVLWKEQSTVWAEHRAPLHVRIAPLPSGPTPHIVARPAIDEGNDSAAADQPTVEKSSPVAGAGAEKPKTWVSANSGPEQPTISSSAGDPTP